MLVLAVDDPATEPFLIISKSFSAAFKFSLAELYLNSASSNSCCEIICLAKSSLALFSCFSPFSRFNFEEVTCACAPYTDLSSGTTLITAIN